MREAVNVVYDCMIFLQAAAQAGRVHATMQLVRSGTVKLYVSPEVVGELRDVLTRPELRIKFPNLKPANVDTFLNDVLSQAKMVENVPAIFSLPRDKKDEPYLNLAIKVQACYLVTWNERHLTYLMRQDTAEGIDFCQRFPNVKIVNPPTMLREISQAKIKAP